MGLEIAEAGPRGVCHIKTPLKRYCATRVPWGHCSYRSQSGATLWILEFAVPTKFGSVGASLKPKLPSINFYPGRLLNPRIDIDGHPPFDNMSPPPASYSCLKNIPSLVGLSAPKKKIFSPPPPNSLQTPSGPLAPPPPHPRDPPFPPGIFSKKNVLPLLGASGALPRAEKIKNIRNVRRARE